MPQYDSDHGVQAAAYNRLRRLQTHSRANIPAMMAQRAGSTFTLHEEPLPIEANEQVLVVVYPQDPFVGEPEVRTMNASDIQPGLINSRVRVADDAELAQPDNDGNYLYWPDTPQFAQVNSFYFTTFTLRMYERYARRMLPWSFPHPRIIIDPNYGNLANAFYSEQDRMIGFHTFERNDDTFRTAWSADIVSHEAAHAILDGLRDLYNESFSLGPLAFHESFGDITAMLVALHDDSLNRRLLEWTDGDLRRDSFVTALAEQLVDVLSDQEDERFLRGHTIYLRNAVNNLQYRAFDELAYVVDNPELELSLQTHNYSRLFTGAFYDIFAGIYEQLNNTMPAHIAIYKARDIMGYLLVTAIELGPIGEFEFKDMALAFLSAEHVLYNEVYQNVVREVFIQRGLCSEPEAQQHFAHLDNLPELYLPETINSGLASALFLEEKLLPALNISSESDLIPMAAYRNAAGYAFLSYFSSQRIQVVGEEFKQFSGAEVDLFGGLTVMFDTNDKLCSAIYRPVNDEDIRKMKKITAYLISENLVADSNVIDRLNIIPQAIAITSTEPMDDSIATKTQLVKYPLIADFLPDSMMDFVDYLSKMKSKFTLDT